MKKQPFLTAKSSLIAITLIAVCAFSTVLLRAQSSEPSSNGEQEAAHAESSRERCNWRCQQGQLLEGSWDVVVTPVVPPGVPPPPSFHAYTTFSRGGGSFGSDRSRPFSKQHGVWEHLGGNRFASTFKEDLFDPAGNFAGILTVRVRTTLTGRDTYVGVANGERRDPNGNLIFSACTTIRGTRIKVEPLPDQCQSITPPR